MKLIRSPGTDQSGHQTGNGTLRDCSKLGLLLIT